MANPTKDNVCPHGNQIEFCVPCDLGEALSSKTESLDAIDDALATGLNWIRAYESDVSRLSTSTEIAVAQARDSLNKAVDQLVLLRDSSDETPACLWQQEDPDNEFFFATTCGQEGVNREMSWIFCPHCGKRLTTSLPEEPTRCIDCGVSLVPEARHFSGCKSHPGERAVNGSEKQK